MTEVAKLKLCKDWLKAWHGNNPEHLVSFYAKDAYFQDPVKPKGIKGREALLRYVTKVLAVYPEWRWEFEEFFPTETGFIVKYTAVVPSSRGEFRFNGLDILELKDGKIIRNEAYFDTRPFVENLRLHEKIGFIAKTLLFSPK